jgi:hypothetical protein
MAVAVRGRVARVVPDVLFAVVSRWMSATELDRIEGELAASWDRKTLAVYGDYLQAHGDPRGELIAIDLHVEANGPIDELVARKRVLIDAWLGSELAARVLAIGAVTDGFIHLRWGLGADELERMLGVDAFASALRELWIEDRDPGLRRAIDMICRAPPRWLERFSLARYPDGFDAELRQSIAIDDERARALVDATPRLRVLTVAGANAFGELVHAQVRELRLYDYNAMACLLRDGAPLISTTDVDLQLMDVPSDGELASLLPAARFPALRRLDLARNERHQGSVLELLRDHPLVPQVAWLRVPSLRNDADVDAIEGIAARMRKGAELVVARAYAGTTRTPSPRITMPPLWPWPRDGLRGHLAVAIPGTTFHKTVDLAGAIEVLQVAFDQLPEPSRQAWVTLWRQVAELPEPRLTFRDPSAQALWFSREALALALEPLDFHDHAAWLALRTVLHSRTEPTVEIQRAYGV